MYNIVTFPIDYNYNIIYMDHRCRSFTRIELIYEHSINFDLKYYLESGLTL